MPTHWKRPQCWEGLRAGGERGQQEDEMVGLHKIVEDRGVWSAAVHGVTKRQTRLSSPGTTAHRGYFQAEPNQVVNYQSQKI